ncbi:hypothetical protein HPB50_022804 [Hyalomma asiaticum]|uniref:Uncharacterized protein n=1 Tax=Hyalomma asiaticum TaxID=266040 RepID=A0ACB7TPW6_HYAAI|nr:hypothetical protein HPB50_022804 [Hyalomma asiaticum]
MPEVVTVEGMDINPDEFHGVGWTTSLGARQKRDPASNAAAAAAAETNASAAKKPGFNAPADGAGPSDAARSRSNSRQPGKQMTWADMVDNNGSTTTTKQGTVVASCTPHKRRAIVVQSEDEPSDVDDITSEVSEAPSNAFASDSNAKKRSKNKRKFSTFQSAITEIKEALMQICGRLDRLERPIAQPKATRTISAPDPGLISSPGPHPALPTHPQPPGPIEKNIPNISFSGYRVSRPTLDPDFKQARGIATLIRNVVGFVERDTPTYKKGLESMLTEIIPSRALKTHLYILNVYSSPTDRLRNFTKFFTSAALQAKDRPLIVAGDFNAHNTLWGYATNDRKGLTLPRVQTL